MTRDRATDQRHDAIRQGETVLELLPPPDAGLVFIGRIETPFKSRRECPRQGTHDGPLCTIHVAADYAPALAGLEAFETIEVLYWLHEARRDLLAQSPKGDGETKGTFALRSPLRPNPIGTALVRLVGIAGSVVTVRGLDCLDGTPLLDLKPDRCAYTPLAPPKA
jgi:tRNA (adenine37-N6)-methyltransferase